MADAHPGLYRASFLQNFQRLCWCPCIRIPRVLVKKVQFVIHSSGHFEQMQFLSYRRHVQGSEMVQASCENCGSQRLESFIDKPGHQLLRCPDCSNISALPCKISKMSAPSPCNTHEMSAKMVVVDNTSR